MKCAACPLGGESRTCYAEAIGSPGLCAMAGSHPDFPGLIRTLSARPPVRPEPPPDPDPFVSAWLARVRQRMRPCGCPPPPDPGA